MELALCLATDQWEFGHFIVWYSDWRSIGSKSFVLKQTCRPAVGHRFSISYDARYKEVFCRLGVGVSGKVEPGASFVLPHMYLSTEGDRLFVRLTWSTGYHSCRTSTLGSTRNGRPIVQNDSKLRGRPNRSLPKPLCYYRHISSEVGGTEDWALMNILIESLCSPKGDWWGLRAWFNGRALASCAPSPGFKPVSDRKGVGWALALLTVKRGLGRSLK